MFHKINVKSKLYDEYEWHSILKVPVLCLMAKGVHSQSSTKASPNQCNEKQCFFGDTPFLMDCPLLVQVHSQKSDEIDCNEIIVK